MFRRAGQAGTAAATVGAALAVTLGGGSAAAAAKPLHIAGVVAITQDPYFISMECGAKAAAKAAGRVTLSWQGPTNASVPAEITALGSVSVTKPDGVILSPFSTTAFVNPVQRLMAGGTPVYLADGPLSKNVAYRQTFTSLTGSGMVLARHIAGLMHGSGQLAIIASTPGDPVEAARYKSMVTVLKTKYPKVKVVTVQYAQDDSNKSAQVTAGLLTAYPHLSAIYTTDGPSGQGASAALVSAHKSGVVKLVSFDATPLLVRGLRDGTIQGLYAQAPYIEGYTAMKGLVAYLRSARGRGHKAVKPAKPYTIASPLKFLTKANMASADSRKFMYRASC